MLFFLHFWLIFCCCGWSHTDNLKILHSKTAWVLHSPSLQWIISPGYWRLVSVLYEPRTISYNKSARIEHMRMEEDAFIWAWFLSVFLSHHHISLFHRGLKTWPPETRAPSDHLHSYTTSCHHSNFIHLVLIYDPSQNKYLLNHDFVSPVWKLFINLFLCNRTLLRQKK